MRTPRKFTATCLLVLSSFGCVAGNDIASPQPTEPVVETRSSTTSATTQVGGSVTSTTNVSSPGNENELKANLETTAESYLTDLKTPNVNLRDFAQRWLSAECFDQLVKSGVDLNSSKTLNTFSDVVVELTGPTTGTIRYQENGVKPKILKMVLVNGEWKRECVSPSSK